MRLSETDNRGSTPLHWACYSKSEFALAYLLAMDLELEAKDNAGFTALHLAIRTVGELNTTRPVRSLLLKGASRKAVTNKGESCTDLIKDNVAQHQLQELHQMLKEPKYIECFMMKTPMVPLRKNHKT